MDTFRRLVEAGENPQSAIETVMWFRQQGDEHGLERYVQAVERKAMILSER